MGLPDIPGFNVKKITALAGDAGNRIYSRLHTSDGTFILLQNPAPINDEYDYFSRIQNYLKIQNVRVPQIIWVDHCSGQMLLEDFGDDMLQDVFQNDDEYALNTLYPKMLDVIARMQSGIDPAQNCPAFDYAFDTPKFFNELMFFYKHFLCNTLGIQYKSGKFDKLKCWFNNLAVLLSKDSKLFTHRDFHSRNVIVRNDQYCVIDFQDARLGPRYYDLASLLRDAYVRLPEQFIETCVHEFGHLYDPDGIECQRLLFSQTCVQRNLKALGTFGYQGSICGNSQYMRYVPILFEHLNAELSVIKESGVRFSDGMQVAWILPLIQDWNEKFQKAGFC